VIFEIENQETSNTEFIFLIQSPKEKSVTLFSHWPREEGGVHTREEGGNVLRQPEMFFKREANLYKY
jgi:hypothetical protein